jgi:dolichol kinase
MKQIAELKYPQTLESSFNQSLESASQLFSSRLSLRSELHLARKVWHMTMGMAIALLYQAGVPVGVAVSILSAFLALALVVEVIRLRHSKLNHHMIRLFAPLMRRSEVNRCTGIPFYLASSIFAIAAFPKPVAVLSILFLACGDPIASLMGILFGYRSVRFANGKSLVGTLAGVVTCCLVALVYLQAIAFPPAAIFAMTLLGGVAGGTAELLPLDMDDNLTIPVVSGFVMWFVYIVLGL